MSFCHVSLIVSAFASAPPGHGYDQPHDEEDDRDPDARGHRPARAEEEVGDQDHRSDDRQRQDSEAGEHQAVGAHDEELLVLLAEVEPVVNRRCDEQDRGQRGGEQREEVEVLLEARDPQEALVEGHHQQEREQHLDAGQSHAQLGQQLGQVSVDPLVVCLGSACVGVRFHKGRLPVSRVRRFEG